MLIDERRGVGLEGVQIGKKDEKATEIKKKTNKKELPVACNGSGIVNEAV